MRAAGAEARVLDPAMFREPADAVEFIATMLEASTEYSIIGADLDGTIVLWNSGARRLYGYSPAEVIGVLDVAALHADSDIAAGLPARTLEGALETGTWEGTVNRRRNDGTTFAARLVVTPRRSSSGAVVGFLLISKDLSAEQQLNEELERAIRAKDSYLAVISHELRAPLSAVIGYTGTLLMGLTGRLNPEQREQLQIVQDAGRHLLTIINDLLDLAKIESAPERLDVRAAGLREVVREAVTAAEPVAGAKGLRIEVDVPDGVDVRADARALARIVGNLLGNAVKFTDVGGVVVAAARAGDRTVLTVADTGIGIAPADQDGLFEPFHQVHDGTRRPAGAGLGLYIARRLARLMDGTIGVISRPGSGSAFTLDLPAS